MLDWFGGSFDGAVDELTAATERPGRVRRGRRRAPSGSCPTTRRVAMRAHLALGAVHGRRRGGSRRRPSPEARAVAASARLPARPVERRLRDAGSAPGCGSRTGRFELAERSRLPTSARRAPRHGFDSWEVIAATQNAALEALAALRSAGADAGARWPSTPRPSALTIELWQMLGLRMFLPFYMTTHRRAAGSARATPTARGQRYEESLALAAETGMRFYDAETQAAHWPRLDSPTARSPEREAAVSSSRARPGRRRPVRARGSTTRPAERWRR